MTNILNQKFSCLMLSQIILSVSGILLLLSSCQQPEDLGGCLFPEDLDASYELIWSDEFDGEEINEEYWSFNIGDGCDRDISACIPEDCEDCPTTLCGWGNNELQYYTDRPENAFVSNGNLIIKAVRENQPYEGYDYTSARMVTKGKVDFRYGRVDVRARLPIGQGLWPAIWMLSSEDVYGECWPKSGEIDIMENIGSEPNKVFGTIHYGHDYWRYIGDDYFLEDGTTFNDDFHVFTLLWNEDCIKFLVDGIEYSGPYTRSTTLPTTWPFDQDFHLILNIAVGGNLPGNPSPATTFPQVMQVDYVRVYQEN
jgi:beta-glucanase (GH16 family)